MILTHIKRFIKQEKIVSLQQISRHFDITPLAIEPMINFWIRKGLVRQCQQGCKTTCFGCSKQVKYYQYIA